MCRKWPSWMPTRPVTPRANAHRVPHLQLERKKIEKKKIPFALTGRWDSFRFQFHSSRENKVLVSSLIVLGLLKCFLLALIVGIVLVKHCVPDRV